MGQTDSMIGRTLGQFEILDEIGRGGMATVYRARQRSINRTVAIKVLPPSLLHDPGFYERFAREVDVIAHLEHPHILPIYDYGEAEGIPYIAMRYLAGGSMAQWLRRGLPAPEALVKPLMQVAQALDHAHQQGIIHRDLKPGNILLDEHGNAYLTDFGIARVLNSSLTGSAIIGTPAYMSPEQANGLPLDARSDIYSLGVVLFELLTGREPYEAETPVALLLKHINEPMPSARAYRPSLPAAVELVIQRATAKQPDERFPSGVDLAEEYRRAVAGVRSPLDAAPIEDSPTLVPDTGAPARKTPRPVTPPPFEQRMDMKTPRPLTPPPTAAPETPRRSPLPLIAAALVVILLAVGGGFALVSSTQTPTPVPTVLPTPFVNAQQVRDARYVLTVPNGWTPVRLSDGDAQVHVWQNGLQGYVGLSLLPAEDDLNAQIDAYAREHFPDSAYALVDESTAPNGTIRRSYQLFGQVEPAFEPGQTDAFFFRQGDLFVVLELYASYRLGNDIVPTFQQVLDSLRVLA